MPNLVTSDARLAAINVCIYYVVKVVSEAWGVANAVATVEQAVPRSESHGRRLV